MGESCNQALIVKERGESYKLMEKEETRRNEGGYERNGRMRRKTPIHCSFKKVPDKAFGEMRSIGAREKC